MAIYQSTAFYACANFGWSETYGQSQANPDDAVINLTSFITLRLATMVNDCSLVGARVSDTAIKGDSYPTGLTFPTVGTFAVTPTDETSARENVVRVMFNAGPALRANRFFHGIPASQYTKTFYAPTTPWGTAFNAFLAALEAHSGTLTKIKGAVTPPFYTFNGYIGYDIEGGDFKKVGRPFGQPRGRRQIA